MRFLSLDEIKFLKGIMVLGISLSGCLHTSKIITNSIKILWQEYLSHKECFYGFCKKTFCDFRDICVTFKNLVSFVSLDVLGINNFRNIKYNNMCTVSVKVNEALLRGINPHLNSPAAIRQWAQQQIDLRIQQMELDDQETMTIEEAREMTLAAVREEYAKL